MQAMHTHADANDWPAFRAALTGGIDVTSSLDGSTVLHMATGGVGWGRGGDLESVRLALAGGADPNARDRQGRTPVYLASYCASPDILRVLVEAGGDVNAVTHRGRTPLVAAVRYSVFGTSAVAAERLHVLLNCPALDTGRVVDGKTAEQWAVQDGLPAMAAMIAMGLGPWGSIRRHWVSAVVRSGRRRERLLQPGGVAHSALEHDGGNHAGASRRPSSSSPAPPPE